MTRDRYEIAPIFGVRPAGVPFDVLERLGTPDVAAAARRAIELETAAHAAAVEALARLAEIEDRGLRERVWKRLKNLSELAPRDLTAHPWLVPCDGAIRAFHAAGLELDGVIAREYRRVHDQIAREAARELPDFLVIESEADAIDRLTGSSDSTSHNSQDRKNDRTLALYLQRVCAKNDTISRFGPVAWGTIVPGDGARIRPATGVASRRIDVELWVVKGLIDHINDDPEAKPELRPRLHPHGRFEGNVFHRLDEDREIALSETERAIADQCDGSVAAYRLDEEALARLVDHGVVICALEPMARDIVPLASLAADIAAWRPGALRDRWQARLESVAQLRDRFAGDFSVAGRRQVLTEVRALLAEVEIDRPENRRTLYAARNPIIENCYQAGDIRLGARQVDALVADAWPWFELFRDAVSFAGARGFHRMHELVQVAPRRNGVLSYSTLGRIAREHGPSIEDDSLGVAVAAETFADLKRELAEELAGRPDAPEWELTASDCAVLRRRHRFPLVGELTYPSADLQIIADSPEAAEAGRMQWLIAELHSTPVLLQHSTYWCCPDKAALATALEKAVENLPFMVRDSGRGIPVHASAESMMDAFQRPIYVGTGRPKPHWHTVRPADAEVIVDEEACDIRLRTASGEDLGSIIHTVRMISAIHPFFPLELTPHTPRLRIGNVVVQRRSWQVESVTLAGGKSTGVSAAFVSAIERERAARGIPRWVFVRPSPGALRDIGLLTRDKDNKPLYIDLESVVFLDILERRLRKYGKLVVTEMLPAPDQMVWRTPEGRYSFELRTNVVPR